jgi:hypothetical protein
MPQIQDADPAQLRKMTRTVASAEKKVLEEYLSALSPVTNPAVLLGNLSRIDPKSTSSAAAKGKEFTGTCSRIAGTKPFNAPGEFGETDMPTLTSLRLELNPFQSKYRVGAADDGKEVVMTHPLKWILHYSGYGPNLLRPILLQRNAPLKSLREFVGASVLLNFMTARQSGFVKVMDGLRYNITTETLPEFGELPLTCVALNVSTTRPSDAAILEMTEISGVDQVEEVIAPSAVSEMADPFRERLLAEVRDLLAGSRAA